MCPGPIHTTFSCSGTASGPSCRETALRSRSTGRGPSSANWIPAPRTGSRYVPETLTAPRIGPITGKSPPTILVGQTGQAGQRYGDEACNGHGARSERVSSRCGGNDGNGRVQFRFQWSNDGSADADITGATDSSYTLVAADDGDRQCPGVLHRQGRYGIPDQRGNGYGQLCCPATDSPVRPPERRAISGTVQVGETLTADTSGIADDDGLANVAYGYRWVANDGTSDTDIAGATAPPTPWLPPTKARPSRSGCPSPTTPATGKR